MDTSVGRCPPRPELRADAARNRAKVLDVARRRLQEGDTTLAMNTISKVAGVGVGTVYRHFPTRRSLLEALATEGLSEIVGHARRAVREPDPLVGLQLLMGSALARQLVDPALAALMALPTFEGSDNLTLGVELRGLAAQLVERAQHAGVLRADIDADDLRRLAVAVYSAVRSSGAEECTGRMLDIMLNGLRPPADERVTSPGLQQPLGHGGPAG